MLRLVLSLAGLAVPWAAQGFEVYRWVDADGITHLSDTRPDTRIEVTTIEIEPVDSAYDAAADPYSVLNQAQRIHDWWLEIFSASSTRTEPNPATSSVPGSRGTRQHQTETRSYFLTSGSPPYPPYPPSNLARQQVRALQQLDLLGTRPASINSGLHRDRVLRSRALPLIVEPAQAPR